MLIYCAGPGEGPLAVGEAREPAEGSIRAIGAWQTEPKNFMLHECLVSFAIGHPQ